MYTVYLEYLSNMTNKKNYTKMLDEIYYYFKNNPSNYNTINSINNQQFNKLLIEYNKIIQYNIQNNSDNYYINNNDISKTNHCIDSFNADKCEFNTTIFNKSFNFISKNKLTELSNNFIDNFNFSNANIKSFDKDDFNKQLDNFKLSYCDNDEFKINNKCYKINKQNILNVCLPKNELFKKKFFNDDKCQIIKNTIIPKYCKQRSLNNCTISNDNKCKVVNSKCQNNCDFYNYFTYNKQSESTKSEIKKDCFFEKSEDEYTKLTIPKQLTTKLSFYKCLENNTKSQCTLLNDKCSWNDFLEKCENNNNITKLDTECTSISDFLTSSQKPSDEIPEIDQIADFGDIEKTDESDESDDSDESDGPQISGIEKCCSKYDDLCTTPKIVNILENCSPRKNEELCNLESDKCIWVEDKCIEEKCEKRNPDTCKIKTEKTKSPNDCTSNKENTVCFNRSCHKRSSNTCEMKDNCTLIKNDKNKLCVSAKCSQRRNYDECGNDCISLKPSEINKCFNTIDDSDNPDNFKKIFYKSSSTDNNCPTILNKYVVKSLDTYTNKQFIDGETNKFRYFDNDGILIEPKDILHNKNNIAYVEYLDLDFKSSCTFKNDGKEKNVTISNKNNNICSNISMYNFIDNLRDDQKNKIMQITNKLCEEKKGSPNEYILKNCYNRKKDTCMSGISDKCILTDDGCIPRDCYARTSNTCTSDNSDKCILEDKKCKNKSIVQTVNKAGDFVKRINKNIQKVNKPFSQLRSLF